MERYLTQKAQKLRWWEMPAAITSGVMTAIGMWVVFTDKNPTDLPVQILAAALFLGLLAWPLMAGLVRFSRRKKAQAIAKCLAGCKESTLTLGALERRTGIKGAEVVINRLTDKGFLKNVDLDAAHGLIRLQGGAAVDTEEKGPVMDTGIEAYNEKLRQIRELNERIDDREVSRKIDRIETLTGGIFKLVAEQPERASDARRFINYYLPTTLKLLESYDLMEDQRYQGENIRASRRQIEEVLDKLIQAIERQQDRLFKYDAIDVEAEIKVMETMMAADGLTEQGLKL